MVVNLNESQMSELRLFLEDVCCDLCRFVHLNRDNLPPGDVKIDREVYLGAPGAFADIRVSPAGRPPYYVEIKYGHTLENVSRQIRRKFGHLAAASKGSIRLVLVVDRHGADWELRLKAELEGLGISDVEIWDEPLLLSMLNEQFNVKVPAISEQDLLELRLAMDFGKGRHAFGEASNQSHREESLRSMLLWHFGFWRLRQMRKARDLDPREILAPGLYPKVAVLLADLCAFSSYVRDTRDPEVVRHSLTSFYTRARYQIINAGGMLYQFVGDQVVGFFGLPDYRPSYLADALETARRLVDIGNSISQHWQRQIDRVQCAGGVHIGIALGDMQIVSLRPFSRAHLSGVGDAINLGARLMQAAGPSDIVVSNAFFNELEDNQQRQFREIEPLEGRNVGLIKAWKLESGLDS